jgi:energy-coupling factor transporter ATPase
MSKTLIRAENVGYTYHSGTDMAIEALRGISLEVRAGEYLAIVGHNGSGKSTLAKCLNGLLLPQTGEVWVAGLNTRDERSLSDIRARVGIVLQNPDNQFVATTVEEEAAFGPENLGLPRAELRVRVDEVLRACQLDDVRQRNPRALSAGQKARLAIAGILAMRPRCLVLDESTALLDPLSRQQILALVRQLHAQGLAIVLITHAMEEAAAAQRLLVLERGHLVLQGSPAEALTQRETLDRLGLALPAPAAIAEGLRQRGLNLTDGMVTLPDLERALLALQVKNP